MLVRWLALATVGLLRCGTGEPIAPGLDALGETAASVRQVRYRLQWQPLPAPQATARIVSGVLHTWSIELVDCPAPRRDLGWLWPIATAWADHGVAANGSRWQANVSEQLGSGAIQSDALAYAGTPCALLWVISHGSRQAGAKLEDPAFEVAVQWQDSGGVHLRQLATAVGHGRKFVLGALPPGNLELVLGRAAAIDLQGLDLAQGATEALAWQVLDRVVAGAAVTAK